MSLKIFKWVIFATLLLECQNLFSFIGYFDEKTDYSFFRGLQPMTYILIYVSFSLRQKSKAHFNGFISFLLSLFLCSIFEQAERQI